jgi:hypothetical protein
MSSLSNTSGALQWYGELLLFLRCPAPGNYVVWGVLSSRQLWLVLVQFAPSPAPSLCQAVCAQPVVQCGVHTDPSG